jgi:hypothetical protein
MASVGSTERLEPGQQVQYDNGFAFLYVDGTCHYWAQDFDPWEGARTGVLSSAQAAQLEATVHYGEWTNGHYVTPNLFDAGGVLLYDDRVQLSCSSPCKVSSAPAFLGDLVAHFDDIITPIWAAGTPLQDTGVRVEAVQADLRQYDFVTHLSWPLAAPLATIAVDLLTASHQGFGHGVSFQGEDAARLRALRATYDAGNYRTLGVYGIPIDDGGQGYLVYLRDSLPFEDGNGLVPRPP